MRRVLFRLGLTFGIVLVLVGVATLAGWAQSGGADTAVASVTPHRVEVGEPVTLTIRVSSASSDYKPPNAAVLKIPDWEIQEAQLVEDPPQGSVRHWRYVMRLVSWNSGSITIPEVEIGAVTTSPLRIEVIPTLVGPMKPSQGFSFWRWFFQITDNDYYDWIILGVCCVFAVLFVKLDNSINIRLWKANKNNSWFAWQATPHNLSKSNVKTITVTKLKKANQEGGAAGWNRAEAAVREYLEDNKPNISWNMSLAEMAARLGEPWATLLHQCEQHQFKPNNSTSAVQDNAELDAWIFDVIIQIGNDKH